MDPQDRLNKINGLQALHQKATDMANKGAGALEVRNFIGEGAKKIAYDYPDEEAFHKAARATLAYKQSKQV
jgi:hypothetical protein